MDPKSLPLIDASRSVPEVNVTAIQNSEKIYTLACLTHIQTVGGSEFDGRLLDNARYTPVLWAPGTGVWCSWRWPSVLKFL